MPGLLFLVSTAVHIAERLAERKGEGFTGRAGGLATETRTQSAKNRRQTAERHPFGVLKPGKQLILLKFLCPAYVYINIFINFVIYIITAMRK